jgi:hypothetical protein
MQPLSKCDQSFEEYKPGYYIFGLDRQWERNCEQCGNGYTTQMEYNRFCSREHMSDYLGRMGKDRGV